MNFLVHSFFALAVFAGHFGLSSLTTSGVPLHLLSILTIVCVWFNATSSIRYRLLPAALLVDILQPSRFPVSVATVLAVWLVASLVQKHWLTNHSVASLAGIALLATIVRLLTTWAAIATATGIDVSNMSVTTAWSWKENLLRIVIETCITLGLGIVWRGLHRAFKRSFIYGTS